MTRLIPGLIVSAPFWLTAAWCATTTSYRHVRVIPAPYDWATDEGQASSGSESISG